MENNKKEKSENLINKLLLFMNYDSKKTLSENMEKVNKLTINEQNVTPPCPESLTNDEVRDYYEKIADRVLYLNTIFVRANYQGIFGGNLIEERCKIIYENILALSKKNFYDELNDTCKSSLDRFNKLFDTYYEDYFSSGDSFEEELTDLIENWVGEESLEGKEYLEKSLSIFKKIKESDFKPVGQVQVKPVTSNNWENYPCVINHPNKKEFKRPDGSYVYQIGDYYYYNKGRKMHVKTREKSNYNCNSPEFKSKKETTPFSWKTDCTFFTYGCKSSKIEEVQRCVGGLVPDGKFGKKTKAKLSTIGFDKGFAESDIPTICGKKPETPQIEMPTPEIVTTPDGTTITSNNMDDLS